jgi:type III restriction enzyme
MAVAQQQDTYWYAQIELHQKKTVDLEVVLIANYKTPKFGSREYQTEAFTALILLNNPKLRAKPSQVLFHMATVVVKH